MTYTDYTDATQRIGLGLITSADYLKSQPYRAAGGKSYGYMFYVAPQFTFIDTCYNTFRKMDNYFDSLHLNYPLDSISYSYTVFYTTEPDTLQTTNTWYPSMDNKQKCPSLKGWNPGTQTYDEDCDFVITNYISSSFNDSLCITINNIPANLFPENELPLGYRIYHNFGEQKTLVFDTFADNDSISFPIEFCITKCDIMFLMALGKENINIAIDFYDEEGRILNNPGCDDLNFTIDFPFDFCDVFEVDVNKIDSNVCCTYEVKLIFDECTIDNSMLNVIKNSILFQSFLDDSTITLSSTDNLVIDYGNGEIKFNFSVCKDTPEDVDYEFAIIFENDGLYCKTEPIEFESCLICDCQFGEEMQSWVELTVEPDADCGPDYCKITGQINIPSIYDCFERYSINGLSLKIPIPLDGSMSLYQGMGLTCLERGMFRQDTIKLYRSLSDSTPCIIYKQVYCPIEDFISPCVPDCDTVPFIYPPRELIFNLSNLGCPNCTVYATYTWRLNTCTGTQDLQVLSFRVQSDESDSLACEMCIITTDQIHREVVLQAIYKNDMGFRPLQGEDEPEGNCDETWRVIQSACWAHYTGIWGDFYYPCDSVECCSIGLRVCRFLDEPIDYITVDTLVSNIADSLCYDGDDPLQQHVYMMIEGTIYNDPVTGQVIYSWVGIDSTLYCLDRCNVLLGLQTDPGGYNHLGKIVIRDDYDIETKEHYGLDEIYIKMKFYEDFVDFYIESDIESQNLNISLYSVYGNKLISNTFGLSKGDNFYQMATSKLFTGLYLISIQVNGSLLKTEKLLIIR